MVRNVLLLLSVAFSTGFSPVPTRIRTANIRPLISLREPFKSEEQDRYAVYSSPTSKIGASMSPSSGGQQSGLDVNAVLKYAAAVLTEVSLFYVSFSAIDKLLASLHITIPFAANCLLFYAIALKSRVFNPLANNRPNPKTLETTTTTSGAQKRVMPAWTPPGFVFPIVWLLLIGPIRAISSALVYRVTGCYAHPAIMLLILHLSVGDVWNTINNVERRYGVAVVGVFGVWLSKAVAAYGYYQVVPQAGQLLGVTLLWLSIASALVTATWRLNPNPQTGKPEPLYPVRGQAQTKFVWFSG